MRRRRASGCLAPKTSRGFLIAKLFPKTGPFDAFHQSHGSASGAWPNQEKTAADRLAIVSFASAGIPAMPSSWGITRDWVGRVRWRLGDPAINPPTTSNARQEWRANSSYTAMPGSPNTKSGDVVWQSWEEYIPPGTVWQNGSFNHIMQWHSAGSPGLPSPTCSINNSTQFSTWAGAGTNGDPSGNRTNTTLTYYPYSAGWHRFLYHIVFGSRASGGGLIEVWVDDFSGAPDLSRSGSNVYDTPTGGYYLKQGIYSGRRTSNLDLFVTGMRLATTRNEVVGMVVVPNTTSDTFSATAHGLSNGSTVQFTASSGGSLPSPILAATNYFVVSSATNSFQVANSSGGSAVNLTSVGSGTIFASPTSVTTPPPDPPPDPPPNPGGPGSQTGADANFYGNNTLSVSSAWAEATGNRKRGILVNFAAEKDATKIVAYLDGNGTTGGGTGGTAATVGEYLYSNAEKTAIRANTVTGGNSYAITARASIISLANAALNHNSNPPQGGAPMTTNDAWVNTLYLPGLSDGHAMLNLARAYMLTGTASYGIAAKAILMDWANTYNPPSFPIGHHVAEPVGFVLKGLMAYTLIIDRFTAAEQAQIRAWCTHFVNHAKNHIEGAAPKSPTITSGPWGNGVQWARAMGCWAGAINGDSTIWDWNFNAPGVQTAAGGAYGWPAILSGVMGTNGQMNEEPRRQSIGYALFTWWPLAIIADLHMHVRPSGYDQDELWQSRAGGRSLGIAAAYYGPYVQGITAFPYGANDGDYASGNQADTREQYRTAFETVNKVHSSSAIANAVATSRASNRDQHILGYNAIIGGVPYVAGGTSATDQRSRGALYNHSSGALIAQTEERIVLPGEPGAWISHNFGSSPRVPAGTDVKAVVHTSSPGGVIRYGYDPLTSGGYVADDTYSDGSAASTTSWTTTNEEAAVYVTWTTPAAAGLAFDATSRGEATGTSLTFSHNCAGTNRVLIVGVSLRNNASQTISGVTYNAVAMTSVGTVANGTSVRTALYRLIAPAAGSNNVVITLSASAQVEGSAVSFSGAHQTTPVGTAVTATGATGAPSVTIPSSDATEIMVDNVALAWATGRTLSAVGAGQTSRQNDDLNDASTGVILGTSTQPGASGAQVMDWTQATSGGGGSTTVAFRAVSPRADSVSGNITIDKPTGTVDNDVMIATIASWDNVVISPPAGWTAIDQQNESADFRGSIFWKRASSEGASYTFTHSAGSDILGYISSWSGCKTSGSPINTFSTNDTNGSSNATVTYSAVTPTVANCMLVAIGAEHDDVPFDDVPSGSNPAFVTAGGVFHSATANDLRLQTWYGTKTDTTSSGARTNTFASAEAWISWLLALEPQVGGTGLDGAWGSVAVSVRPATAAAGDTQPPSLVSATVSGTTLTLNYNELLDSASVSDVGSFSVLVNNLANAVTLVAVSNFTITLTLTTAVVVGDIVLLSYLISPPGIGTLVPLDTLFPSDALTSVTEGAPIQDVAGNDAVPLTLIPVTNLAADVIAPALVSAVIDDDLLILTYDENLDSDSVPSTADFYVGVNGETVTIAGIELGTEFADDPREVAVILTNPVTAGQTVTVTYVPAANPIQDLAGNNALALTDQAVTNSTGETPGTPGSLNGWRAVTTETAIWEEVFT